MFMKKKLAILLSSLILAFSLAGCGNAAVDKAYDTESEEKVPSIFTEIESTGSWRIVYHKETKVMYAVSWSSYNSGNFTLLVDENGDPLLYEGE